MRRRHCSHQFEDGEDNASRNYMYGPTDTISNDEPRQVKDTIAQQSLVRCVSLHRLPITETKGALSLAV